MRVKKKFWLYVVLAVLYIAPYIALFQSIGKGDIKGGFNDEDRSNSTLVVTDTTNIIAPTAASEQLLRYDEVVLERADKVAEGCGKKEKEEKRNVVLKGESGKLEASCETALVSDNERLTSDTASCQQVSDSVRVVVPITERTYEDSTYRAVVRGYMPELVSLDIYNRTQTITKTKTKKPMVVVSAGVYGGFGAKGMDYGLGISIGVPIWSW